MEKTFRVFKSFDDADAADAERDRQMTPQERLRIVFALNRRYYAEHYPPHAPEPRLERVFRIAKLDRS